jgi:hypothetical protein
MGDLAELLEGSGIVEGEGEGEGEVKGEEGKVEEKKEETTTEETTPTVEEKKEESPFLSLEEQNRELRQMLRAQKRDISILQSKLERVEKRSSFATKQAEKEVDEYSKLFGSEKLPEPGEKDGESKEQLSALEIANQELLSIASQKAPILETMVELMELTPKYQDVRDVCSQSNFQDIFDSVGEEIARREGKDPSLASLEVEAAVWKMANPYKYMYGIIKQYHPKYAGKEEKAPAPPVTNEPKKTPTSLANVPGKTSSKGAWNSARIDEMSVEELDSVPADIYDKYLKGELD